jgi:uncharacterized protein (TIGR01777 family)
MRVFVAGGTGMIGSRLVRALAERKDEVVLLTRRPEAVRQALGPACQVVAGDPTQPGPWMEAVDGCEAVVNLAGENLFNRRWNAAFKQLLRDSRLRSTDNVVQALARRPRTAAGAAKVLVNASAIGYYGPHGDEELTEDSPPGDDFLARLCVDWEQAARGAEGHGVRLALVRVGVVLGRDAGPVAKLMLPFKMGTGGPVGSGKQWLSWVHHADIVGILLLALDNGAAQGPLNGTAPQPVTNREFAKAFGRALNRPAFLPTPGFALYLMLGEVAELLTAGQRVLPRRAQALGYAFRFPDIDSALRDVLQEPPP